MTYNLQSGFAADCRSDVPAQGKTIKAADFAGLQEVVMNVDTRCNCDMSALISKHAEMDTRFLMTMPFRTGKYGIMAASGFPILETKTILFQFPNTEQRAAVALLTHPAQLNGRPLWFLSTHLDYDSWHARQSQVDQLIDFVNNTLLAQTPNAVVVVSGDFNGGPDDKMYYTMSGYFKNGWETHSKTKTGGATLPAWGPAYRFDHIWFRMPSVLNLSIRNAEVVDVKTSDHRPFVVTVAFD